MLYTCPHCNLQFQGGTAELVECPSCKRPVKLDLGIEDGCDWDRESGGRWFDAFFKTFKKAIIDSARFFAAVAKGDGMKRPFIYALMISYIMFAASVAYQVGFQALAMSFNFAGEAASEFLPALAISIPIAIIFGLIFFIIGVPILTAMMIFVRAGLYHLCLMMLGSVNRDFQATCRVVCYASSPQLFQVVPILGGMVSWIWQLVLDIIGLKQVHKISYGKSVLAVFLPTIVCCGGIMLLIMMVVGGIFAAVVSGAG